MLNPGMHTDNWRTLSGSFEQAVTVDLATEATDESTGIAMFESPIGSGINAENISECIQFMNTADWDGVISIECLGTDDILQSSTAWLRSQITQ